MELITKSSLTPEDTKGKYIFWDIDGTLAPYRFNGHVSDPEGSKYGMNQTEVKNGLFLTRLPSKHMQRVVETSGAKEHIIMGHVLSEREIGDKYVWLDKHFPCIKERLLTFENVPKYQTISNYCKEHNIDLKDVIYVDDILIYIKEAERNGIPSYHISSLLDWEYYL